MNDGGALRDVVDFAVKTCPADGTESIGACWSVIAFLVGRLRLVSGISSADTLAESRVRNREALVEWLASQAVPA